MQTHYSDAGITAHSGRNITFSNIQFDRNLTRKQKCWVVSYMNYFNVRIRVNFDSMVNAFPKSYQV